MFRTKTQCHWGKVESVCLRSCTCAHVFKQQQQINKNINITKRTWVLPCPVRLRAHSLGFYFCKSLFLKPSEQQNQQDEQETFLSNYLLSWRPSSHFFNMTLSSCLLISEFINTITRCCLFFGNLMHHIDFSAGAIFRKLPWNGLSVLWSPRPLLCQITPDTRGFPVSQIIIRHYIHFLHTASRSDCRAKRRTWCRALVWNQLSLFLRWLMQLSASWFLVWVGDNSGWCEHAGQSSSYCIRGVKPLVTFVVFGPLPWWRHQCQKSVDGRIQSQDPFWSVFFSKTEISG